MWEIPIGSDIIILVFFGGFFSRVYWAGLSDEACKSPRVTVILTLPSCTGTSPSPWVFGWIGSTLWCGIRLEFIITTGLKQISVEKRVAESSIFTENITWTNLHTHLVISPLNYTRRLVQTSHFNLKWIKIIYFDKEKFIHTK